MKHGDIETSLFAINNNKLSKKVMNEIIKVVKLN